jgi:hypothetical protein
MQERGEPHIPVLPRHPAHAIQPAWRALPAPSPERVALATFPSGDPLPSTTSATPTGALFGSFAGTTGPSDFPRSCITGLRPRPFPHDPPNHHHKRVTVGPPGSRAWRVHAHAQVLRPRGVRRTARENAANGVAFRALEPRRHPVHLPFRGSIAQPARTPVNASLRPRGSPTHDSGPSWVATPSMSDSFIPFSRPVYPGAFSVAEVCRRSNRARRTCASSS